MKYGPQFKKMKKKITIKEISKKKIIDLEEMIKRYCTNLD